MPRSIQEILDHADELAKRFEDYEPKPGDERPLEEYLLERAAIARARGNNRSSMQSLQPGARACPGNGSATSLARRPKQPSNATALPWNRPEERNTAEEPQRFGSSIPGARVVPNPGVLEPRPEGCSRSSRSSACSSACCRSAGSGWSIGGIPTEPMPPAAGFSTLRRGQLRGDLHRPIDPSEEQHRRQDVPGAMGLQPGLRIAQCFWIVRPSTCRWLGRPGRPTRQSTPPSRRDGGSSLRRRR